jgi:TonB family protein
LPRSAVRTAVFSIPGVSSPAAPPQASPDPPRLPDGTPPPLRGEVGNASSSGGRQTGGGSGRGVIQIGGGVRAPVPIYQVEPEYSEEARKAKWQGTVLVSLVVDETGKPVPGSIKVTKSLGLGLDQKAIEAVEKWRFKPTVKNGKPVSVLASVEVNFRLL